MLPTQLKATVALIILFLTVSIAAKAIGSLQPINPALRGFVEGCENQPQPCWYGIVPGVTTVNEAKIILQTKTFSVMQEPQGSHYAIVKASLDASVCKVELDIESAFDKIVSNVRLLDCPELPWGGLAAIMGMPNGIGGTVSCEIKDMVAPMSWYWLSYNKGISISIDSKINSPYRIWLSPFGQVQQMDINSFPKGSENWNGLLMFWQYYRHSIGQIQTSSCE